MMINTVSIFGFHLPWLPQTLPDQDNAHSEDKRAQLFGAEDASERADREKEEEAFFWGMYPVY